MEEKTYSVLVIDDEESMRDSCCLILAKEGFDTDSAPNGQAGLEKIQASPPRFCIDRPEDARDRWTGGPGKDKRDR